MSTLAILMLASTPAFEPVRNHTWGEPAEIAHAIETTHQDTLPTDLLVPIVDTGAASRKTFLHYTFNTPVPFEFIALDFDGSRLSRILYPLHLPGLSTGEIEKPFTDVPEKFQAVRAWLTQHLGEPDVFTTSIEGYTANFSDTESLLEIDAYTFNYTWCSQAANAYLIALREAGRSPVVVASLTPPAIVTDAGTSDSTACENPGELADK